MELLQYIFSKVLFMSLASFAVYIQVRILQFVIRKIANKQWLYYSWLLLIVFLLVPVKSPGIRNPWLNETPVETMNELYKEDSSMAANQELLKDSGFDQTGISNDIVHKDQTAKASAWSIFLKYASIIWAMGMLLILLARIIIREQYKYKLHKKTPGQFIDPEWECYLRELLFKEAAVIHMRRIPRINVSFHVSSPMIFGVLKPTIYLPAVQTDLNELEVILKHELIHYQRMDLMYKELMSVTKMVHWFNPLIWIVEKQLDNACELSCDELVIEGMNSKERRFYGKTLLSTIFQERQLNQYTIATLHRKGGSTETRIKEIMGFNKTQVKFIVMIGVMCLFAGVGVTSMVSAAIINGSNHTVYIEKESTDNVMKTTAKSNDEMPDPEDDNEIKPGKSEDLSEPITPYDYEQEYSKNENDKQDKSDTKDEYDDIDSDDEYGERNAEEFDRVGYRYKGKSIQYYMNHPELFDQETLNGAFTDYIAKSEDIGAIFTVIDLLSKDTIDEIAETYIEKTKDYGMYYSLSDYLSDAKKTELKKTVEENMGPVNTNGNFSRNW